MGEELGLGGEEVGLGATGEDGASFTGMKTLLLPPAARATKDRVTRVISRVPILAISVIVVWVYRILHPICSLI